MVDPDLGLRKPSNTYVRVCTLELSSSTCGHASSVRYSLKVTRYMHESTCSRWNLMNIWVTQCQFGIRIGLLHPGFNNFYRRHSLAACPIQTSAVPSRMATLEVPANRSPTAADDRGVRNRAQKQGRAKIGLPEVQPHPRKP